MKRFVGVLVFLAMAVTLFAAGEADKAVEAAAADIMTPPGQLPIIKNPGSVTISAFIPLAPKVDDYKNNEFTKYLEEQTGVNMAYMVSPAADAKSKLNLLLSSGNYPDIIFGQLSRAEMSFYGQEGLLLALDEINQKWGFYTKRVFAEYPQAMDVLTGADGKMYALPHINICYHCQYNGRLWMRWDWIKNVGMEPPETTEDFLKLLRAFKTQDPNGNGKADEIPLAGTSAGSSRLENYFMNAFMPYPSSREYMIGNSFNVTYDKPEYREGLRYLHLLHSEGLLLNETFTIRDSDLRQLGEFPEAVILGSFTAWGPENATIKDGPSGRWHEYFAYPALKGPTGVRYSAWVGPYNGIGASAFITDNAKHPEVAFRVLDFYYKDDEVLMRWYLGRPGIEWEFRETGAVKQLVTYGAQPMNVSHDQTGISFRSNDFWLALLNLDGTVEREIMRYVDTKDLSQAKRMASLKEYNEVMKYYNMKVNYSPYQYPDNVVVPPLIWDSKDLSELADLKSQLDTYVVEMQARFVTGDVSLDTGWENYLRELQNLNLDRYLELNQKAFDTKYRR